MTLMGMTFLDCLFSPRSNSPMMVFQKTHV